MAPSSNTLFKGASRVHTSPVSCNDATGPRVCALCGKVIKGGERFLTLSVNKEVQSRRPDVRPSDPRSGRIGGPTHPQETLGTTRVHRQMRHRSASATCHLKCLHCIECGYPLAYPPPGASDNGGLLFDSGGARAAYEHARSAEAGRPSGRRAFTVGASLPGDRDERWVANILKNFVAHAKCAERVCAACGDVIHPGEQQVTLPRSLTLQHGPLCCMEGGTSNSQSPSLQPKPCSSKDDGKKMVPQHVRCTRCSTCGLSLAADDVPQDSRAGESPSAQRPQNVKILLDDSGRPHHSSCMVCCCCRQPLFGRYEVHSFFGYLNMCQQALGDDPPLLPLPQGRAAALFGAAKTGGNTCLQKSSQHATSPQSRSSTGTTHLQQVVTPLYNGLCCSWCQGRVPCCVSCERRCTVYTDANGQQFLPRALASKAQRAAELAAAISLGHVTRPPEPETSDRPDEGRKSAAASRSSPLHKFTSGTLSRTVYLNTLGSNRAEGRLRTSNPPVSGMVALRNRSLKTRSSHTLKTAEMHGVLCGQCASLSVVETEDHLRSCVDSVLQFFRDEGVTFSAEMMHLQHLMNQVSKETEKTRAKRPMGRKSGITRRAEFSASSARSSAASNPHSKQQIENDHSEKIELRRRKLVSKEMKPLQHVEAAGLRVDLVDFDALNDGQPQRNKDSFLYVSIPSLRWLPAAQDACDGGTMSSFPCRHPGSGGTGECASLLVTPLYPSHVRPLLCGRSRPSGAAPTLRRTLADVNQHKHTTSRQIVSGEPSKRPKKSLRALNLNGGETCSRLLQHHVFHSAVQGSKGQENFRLLFGRCHVVEVSLVVAADAAPQFDKQLRAMQRRNLHTRTGDVRAGAKKLGSSGTTGRASTDVALRRLETTVPRDTFEAAAACAAFVEEEGQQLSRASSSSKREDENQEGGDANVAVTAGALLLTGSFAGGLLKTASGLHARGLCVRLVKRVVVVGALPRIMVLQHLAHELIHAFLACKQKAIDDLAAEEGACNLAAAAVLLQTGVGLKRLLRNPPGKSTADMYDNLSKDGEVRVVPSRGETTPPSDSVDKLFELLLVRYRLWKMVESTDEVYGVGYRRCLQTVGSNQLTFGAFVSHLLKGRRK